MKRRLLRLRVVAEFLCEAETGEIARVEETAPAFLYAPFGPAWEEMLGNIRLALFQLEEEEGHQAKKIEAETGGRKKGARHATGKE